MAAPRLPAFLADHPRASGVLVLTGARVFDGSAVAPHDRATVVIRDGRFARIDPHSDAIPDGAQVIDLGGRFVMPGLIDAHAHLSMVEHSSHFPRLPKGAEPLHPEMRGHLVAATLRRALRMGVTTIRDVGAVGDVVLQVRQAMRYGAFAGPRLLISGRIVSATAPGGRFFPGMYREADGPDDMRRAAREQIRAGADFVKIMSTGARSVELENPHPSQVTRAEMNALVDETHRQGLRVAAHCEGLGGTEYAIGAGADTIEHGLYLNQRPDLLQALARRDGVLVPTLSFLHHVAEGGEWTPLLEQQGRYNVDQAHLTLAAARAHGVRLALGFDSPDADLAATELCRMVDSGLPVVEALAASTSGGATALGIDSAVGTISDGKLADLLVIDGDPLDDPTVLTDPARVWLVLRNGAPVAGTRMDRTMPWMN